MTQSFPLHIDNRPASRLAGLVLALILLGAAARLACCLGELWLDEVISLRLLGAVTQPLGVFALYHDNNHPLNSLYLYFIPFDSPNWAFRMFSWVAGIVVMLVGARLVRAHLAAADETSEPDSIPAGSLGFAFGAFFLSSSYILVQYASEARGYSPAMAFGLLGWLVLHHAGAGLNVKSIILYAVASTLAVLAQPVAIAFLIGGFCWLAWRLFLSRQNAPNPSRLNAVAILLSWNIGPAAACLAYYFGFVRHLTFGGGIPRPLFHIFASASACTLGLPFAREGLTAWTIAASLLLLAIWACGAVLLVRRKQTDVLVLYAGGAWVAPALTLVASPAGATVYERHFLPTAVISLLLLSQLFSFGFSRFAKARPVLFLFLALFLAGNGRLINRLISVGRGGCQEAVIDMLQASKSTPVTVAGNHDYRNKILLDFFSQRIGERDAVRYVPADKYVPGGADFHIIENQSDAPADSSPAGFLSTTGIGYEKEATYPYAGLSGVNWIVYRRADLRHGPVP